jgi:tubulin polyglutamylase TTLL6/13
MARSYIHLTNYSLNKTNPNYVFNTSEKDMDKGHKRTLSSTYERLAKNGVDVELLKARINDAIVKSVISGLPSIRHQYQYCQPEEYEGGMCFHILGFDVMMTDDFKPIVIEVNHTPSF